MREFAVKILTRPDNGKVLEVIAAMPHIYTNMSKQVAYAPINFAKEAIKEGNKCPHVANIAQMYMAKHPDIQNKVRTRSGAISYAILNLKQKSK